jgi:hypothetical protein
VNVYGISAGTNGQLMFPDRRQAGFGECFSESGAKPQGLKPTHSMQLIGTTEVVPFQNEGQSEFFRKL